MSQYPLTVVADHILYVVLRHVTTYLVLLIECLYSLVKELLRDVIERPHLFLRFFYLTKGFFLFLSSFSNLHLLAW